MKSAYNETGFSLTRVLTVRVPDHKTRSVGRKLGMEQDLGNLGHAFAVRLDGDPGNGMCYPYMK